MLPLPPFLQTCTEVGEERYEFSPCIGTHRNSNQLTDDDFFYLQHNWVISVSADQAPLAPDGRDLHQPRPPPSNRIV